VGEVAAVIDEVLGPVAGAAVGVLGAAGHLVHGAAHLARRVTGEAADGGLGTALEMARGAAELIAVHDRSPAV
jgi:hypothetical protein